MITASHGYIDNYPGVSESLSDCVTPGYDLGT